MKRLASEPPLKAGVGPALRELELELDEVESQAVAEISHLSTRIKGKIRLEVVREARTTLRLIGSRYRSGF